MVECPTFLRIVVEINILMRLVLGEDLAKCERCCVFLERGLDLVVKRIVCEVVNKFMCWLGSIIIIKFYLFNMVDRS